MNNDKNNSCSNNCFGCGNIKMEDAVFDVVETVLIDENSTNASTSTEAQAVS